MQTEKRSDTALREPELRPLTPVPEVDGALGWLAGRIVGVGVGLVLSVVFVIVIGSTITTMTVSTRGEGRLEPGQVWTVRASMTGAVVEVFVAAGDTVEAGALLVRQDSSSLQQEIYDLRQEISDVTLEAMQAQVRRPHDLAIAERRLDAAAANERRALAGVRAAMANLAIDTAGGSATTIPTAEPILLAVARAEHAAASAQRGVEQSALQRVVADTLDAMRSTLRLDALSRRLAFLQTRTARTQIRAPAFGVVLSSEVRDLAGRTLHEGDPVLQIAEPMGWHVIVRMDESHVRNVREGNSASLSAKVGLGSDEIRIPAVVTKVSLEPDPENPDARGVPTYTVRLRPTSTTQAHLESARRGFGVGVIIATGRASLLDVVLNRLTGDTR